MAARRKVWDQRTGEDDEAYADFLFYRNLGPNRSLRSAYRKYIRLHVKPENPGSTPDYRNLEASPRWKRLYRENEWKSRAVAWDISALRTDGGTILALQSRSLRKLARKACAAASRVQISTDDPRELMDVLKTIQQYLTPELAAAQGNGDVAEVVESKAVAESVE